MTSASQAVFVLLTALLSLSAFSQARPAGGRVINGTDADPNSIPYIVSLQNVPGSHSCGGSILNEYYVLTAAHCSFADDVVVVAGEHDLEETSAVEQHIPIEKWIVHEEFSRDTLYIVLNDIALLKLATPIQFNEQVEPINLPEAGEEVAIGALGLVSGWGMALTDDGEDYLSPTILQYANIPVHTTEECHEYYTASDFDVHPEQAICAGGSGTSACWGDSGGPLVVDGKQMGIVNGGDVAGGICYNFPTIFAKVAYHIDWIHGHMEI